MYKIKIDHLEQVKKALVESNRLIQESITLNKHHQRTHARNAALKENVKAIKLIDDEYLNIKS